MAVTAWVRAHPVMAFYALAFTITWLSWWPMALHHRGLVHLAVPGLFFVGGLGPGIAAWVVARIVRGTRGPAELFRPLLRWRVGARWLLVAILLWPAIWLLSVALNGTLDEELATVGAVPVVAVSLVRYLLAAVPEEVGWRVLGVFSAAPWTTTVITVAAAVIVVAVLGPEHLCRTGRRVTLPATSGRTGPTTTEDARDAAR